MANLMKLCSGNSLQNLVKKSLITNSKSIVFPINRLINTNSSKPVSHMIDTPPPLKIGDPPPPQFPSEEHLEKKDRNWISWGFSDEDELEDRLVTHITFFSSISLCFVLIGTIIAYLPDPRAKEWAQREAYLQLRYREDNNLPPIDKNYIDPSKIILPPDDELTDEEIII